MRWSEHGSAGLRPAEPADLPAIISIARATGQDEDWDYVYPAYIGHLLTHGSLIVAERAGTVAGFGATVRIGAGQASISMLTDLFVAPAAHGIGIGRALLGALWSGERRRMTFSSLHANALPLYTSFGVDAWWPLLYLRGDVGRLATPGDWSVSAADTAAASELERGWTGIDRGAEHELWAGWPAGSAVVASLRGRPVAAGTVGGAGAEFGICHLAVEPAAGGGSPGTGSAVPASAVPASAVPGSAVPASAVPASAVPASAVPASAVPASAVPGRAADGDAVAANAVIAVLSWLEPADGMARVCLPAPHPATRPLLQAGWRVEDFDLHMASEFGLIDARRLVPSPALA